MNGARKRQQQQATTSKCVEHIESESIFEHYIEVVILFYFTF